MIPDRRLARVALAAGGLLVGCHRQPSPAPARPAAAIAQVTPASAMVGTWDLSPAAGARGPQLTLAVDSARGETIYGRLTRALSGDVMLDPSNFRAFTGTAGSDSVVRIGIEASQPGAPRTDIVGHLSGATLTITSFVWGGAEQMSAGRRWMARRVR